MTVREQLRYLLRDGITRTATESARALGLMPATVSSELHRMLRRAEVRRLAGYGPRGGFGYFLRGTR